MSDDDGDAAADGAASTVHPPPSHASLHRRYALNPKEKEVDGLTLLQCVCQLTDAQESVERCRMELDRAREHFSKTKGMRHCAAQVEAKQKLPEAQDAMALAVWHLLEIQEKNEAFRAKQNPPRGFSITRALDGAASDALKHMIKPCIPEKVADWCRSHDVYDEKNRKWERWIHQSDAEAIEGCEALASAQRDAGTTPLGSLS